MTRFVALVAVIAFCFSLGFAADAVPTAKTFGKALTLKDVTPISKINSDPTSFKNKSVLVTGKVVNVCQEKGCWVEVEAADSARILCKSMDETVLFPKDCVGSTVRIQGKVLVDTTASAKPEMKSEGGKAAHACPARKVKLSIRGAEMQLLAAAPAAPATDAKAEVKDAKKDAPKTDVKAEVKTEVKEEKKDDKK